MELIIDGLSKTYSNGVQALRDVSLTIPQGMFGLLGPNGAGKSTLMRTVATLQDADSGTITMDGIDVLEDRQTVRECLGYLPQDFGLYPRINAETMLNHIAQMKGIETRKNARKWSLPSCTVLIYTKTAKRPWELIQEVCGSALVLPRHW